MFSEERKELAKRIRAELGYDTFLFEDKSRPYPARDVYSTGIEQSNLFIGIYGKEYGWIDPENEMKISGIHDEYLIAKNLNRRCFAFIQKCENRDKPLQELIEKEIYKITATHFENKEELYKKVLDSLKQFAHDCVIAGSESNEEISDYAYDLIENYKTKYIIETSFYKNHLCPMIKKHKKIYVYGDQGCGKTIVLMLIAKEQKAIYISLRNRSLANVLGYILNKLINISGRRSCKYTSIDDTVRRCEYLLRTNSVLLLIDDVDQNPEVAKSLLALENGKSTVIYSGRKDISNYDIVTIKCTGFTPEESKIYLSNIASRYDMIFQNEAIEKSKGNPQYLTYYCNTANQEPADSLESYHEKIFNKLSPSSQEILAILSKSQTILNIEKIATIISSYRRCTVTAVALSKELEEIEFLVAQSKGIITILHPAFSEYIDIKVTDSGVSFGIHKAIAEIYSNVYEIHYKLYHMVCAGDGEIVYDDLPNSELNAHLSGSIHILRKLLTEDILISRRRGEEFRLGYALYNTALLKKDQYGELAGLNTLKLAENKFIKEKRREWLMMTRSIKATFLVDLGRGNEAIDMLQKLVKYFHKKGLIHPEAITHTNLSYSYQRLGLMDKVESECLKAKELHEIIGDNLGVATCLMNMNTVYIATGKHDKLINSCTEIQKIAKKINNLRLEAGAQNGLTAYYRRKKLYDKAEEAAKKSIIIAQELNHSGLIAINYGNLGNVYRDQGRLPEAKLCHKKVLNIGIKIKSKSHIAHAKGRLAEINDDEKKSDSAIQYGYEAIQIWRELDNAYEIASESRKQAERILKFAGFDWKKSISLYQDSIKYYLFAGLKKDAFDSYRMLIDICQEHLDRFLAVEKVNEALSLFSTPEYSAFVNCILEEVMEWNDRSKECLDIEVMLKNALNCISDQLPKHDLFDLVRHLSAILKLFKVTLATNCKILIEHLLSMYKKEKYDHYLTAIAITLEQIPVDIEENSLTSVFEKLNILDNAIHFRHEKWLDDQWLVCFNANNAPMVDIRSGNTINERIVASLVAVLTLRIKNDLEELIGNQGWKRIGLIMQTLDENECRKHNIPLPDFERDWPIMISEFTKDEYRDETFSPILVGSNYVNSSDHRKYPNNKNIICLSMQLINEMVAHFTGESFPEKKRRKFRQLLIQNIFDVSYKPERI